MTQSLGWRSYRKGVAFCAKMPRSVTTLAEHISQYHRGQPSWTSHQKEKPLWRTTTPTTLKLTTGHLSRIQLLSAWMRWSASGPRRQPFPRTRPSRHMDALLSSG